MDDITAYLDKKYKRFTLTKKELSFELNISMQTIDRRIKEGSGIPNYIRSGNGTKSSYIFPIHEVSKFISTTVKVY